MMFGWKSDKDGNHFKPEQKKKVQGVQSSVESKGITQHHFLKRQESKMMKNWGFDLTKFNEGGFKKVLDELKISGEPENNFVEYDGNDPVRRGFLWKGDGIEIETAANPFTGEMAATGGFNERDYASYIGISGEPDKVDRAVKLIKENRMYSKDESPNEREFI